MPVREAARKACGVLAAMLPELSWTPPPPTVTQ